MEPALHQKILKSNLDVHRMEAPLYNRIHSEIFNAWEQHRLSNSLREHVSSLPDPKGRALDLGCGTGNVTEKLLKLGLQVEAVDLSPDMTRLLKERFSEPIQQGRLQVYTGTLETLPLSGPYDLITMYSVLHHLPDYLSTVESCLRLLRPGGLLWVDHEALPESQISAILKIIQKARSVLQALLRLPYLSLRKSLKHAAPSLYARMMINIDYTWSDYWTHGNRSISTDSLQALARQYRCRYEEHAYLLHQGHWVDYLTHPLLRRAFSDTRQIIFIRSQ